MHKEMKMNKCVCPQMKQDCKLPLQLQTAKAEGRSYRQNLRCWFSCHLGFHNGLFLKLSLNFPHEIAKELDVVAAYYLTHKS